MQSATATRVERVRQNTASFRGVALDTIVPELSKSFTVFSLSRMYMYYDGAEESLKCAICYVTITVVSDIEPHSKFCLSSVQHNKETNQRSFVTKASGSTLCTTGTLQTGDSRVDAHVVRATTLQTSSIHEGNSADSVHHRCSNYTRNRTSVDRVTTRTLCSESERSSAESQGSSADSLEGSHVRSTRNKGTKYLDIKSRMKSLWNNSLVGHLPAVQTAKAGFYFDKYTRCVKCVHCNFVAESEFCQSYELLIKQHSVISSKCNCPDDTDSVNSINDSISSIKKQDQLSDIIDIEWLSTVRQLSLRDEYVDLALQRRMATGKRFSKLVSFMLGVMSVEDEKAWKITAEQTESRHTPEKAVVCNSRRRARKGKRVFKQPIEPQSESLIHLQEEESAMMDDGQCLICTVESTAVVFMPCGHYCSCTTCAPALKNCPICRTLIDTAVTVYNI